MNHNDKYNPYINTGIMGPKHIPLNRKLPGEVGRTHNIRRSYQPAHVDENHLPSHDLRQRDKPNSLGQQVLNQSFDCKNGANPRMYDQYKQFEKGRRCNSLKNNNPYEAGNEFEDEKLYSKLETGDLKKKYKGPHKSKCIIT